MTTTIIEGATPTFAVFAAGSDYIAFHPAGNRIFVLFRDSGGEVKGATSVAVRTLGTPTANVAPVANAGAAQTVVAGSTVTLDGSASSDANSDPLTFAWALTSKPASSAATLSGATIARTTFVADLAGTYIATLVVNDGKVNSAPATTSSSSRLCC
ncbi:MAG: PKD domain-containing protein [Burkholderiaceae bacterium]|nr:PKD domain-containing protein [Burkholderiaceae bacterium]